MVSKQPLAQNNKPGAREEEEGVGWGEDWGTEPKLSDEELKNFDYANTNLNKCTDQ